MDWSALGSALVEISIFSLVGIIFMALGYRIIDWIIPADLNKELEKGNLAVGVVVAGVLIAVALIVSSVVGL